MKISVDGTSYDFDQGRLMLSEARLIEKNTGMTIPRWQKALDEFNSDALAGLVLLLRRRAGETELQFEDVEFDVASLTIDDDAPAAPPHPPEAADVAGAT